jgi:hypothetical protein
MPFIGVGEQVDLLQGVGPGLVSFPAQQILGFAHCRTGRPERERLVGPRGSAGARARIISGHLDRFSE